MPQKKSKPKAPAKKSARAQKQVPKYPFDLANNEHEPFTDIEAEIEAERQSNLKEVSSSSSCSSMSTDQKFRIFFKDIVKHSSPTKVDLLSLRHWLIDHGCRDEQLKTLTYKEGRLLTERIWLSERKKQEHRKELKRAREFIAQDGLKDEKSGTDIRSRNEKQPLSDKEEAVVKLLEDLPERKGLTGRKILESLDKQQIYIDQSTLTKSIIPRLKRKGYKIKNMRDGAGYFLEK